MSYSHVFFSVHASYLFISYQHGVQYTHILHLGSRSYFTGYLHIVYGCESNEDLLDLTCFAQGYKIRTEIKPRPIRTPPFNVTLLDFYLPRFQKLMQSNSHQKPKPREEHVHKDPVGKGQPVNFWTCLWRGRQEGTRNLMASQDKIRNSFKHLRLSIQTILSLGDSDRLVKHCILENVALLFKKRRKKKERKTKLLN